MTSTDWVPVSTVNLTLRQVMMSFAYLAYCGQDITSRTNPDPESEILGLINSAMQKIPPLTPVASAVSPPQPNWNVVWGPAVFTMPGALYQDNMMFVAQNRLDSTQYAVAIRGTNFISDLDWLMEDLDIFQMIRWPAKVVLPGVEAMISESTSIDLQIVLKTLKDKRTGTHLLDFLKLMTSQPVKLCVTGHSLGGCVAGTLALYLKDNRDWDHTKNSVVCCITFAAPTAGDAEFAAYSDRRFKDDGSGTYPGWDTSLGTNFDAVRCSLDVAPLGWTTDAVTIPSGGYYPKVLTIYLPNLDFTQAAGGTWVLPPVLQGYVCPWLEGMLTLRNYRQVVRHAAPLTGIFNKSFLMPLVDAPMQDYLTAFIEQARYQHGSSYPCLLGVPELNDQTVIVTERKPPSDSHARYWRRSVYAARRMASARSTAVTT